MKRKFHQLINAWLPVLALFCVCVAPGRADDALGAAAAGAAAEEAYDAGDYELAEPLYLRAVAACKDDHCDEFVHAVCRLANCYYMSGNMRKAEALYRRAVKLDEELHGTDSLKVADDLFELSRATRRQYLWAESEPIIMRYRDIRRKQLGEEDRAVAMSWMDLAVNYQRQNKLPEAEACFQKTIAIREHAFADIPRFKATAYFLYSQLLEKMERPEEARGFLRRAKTLFPECYDPK